MSGVNKVILLGHLGKDPESRTLENGHLVCTFSLATSESYKDKNTGEKKEITDWHNVVLWRGTAEIAAKYLHKGDKVYIEGKIRTRSWEKDGIKRYTTEILGEQIVLIGGSNGSGRASKEEAASEPAPAPDTTDDLPF